jgi:hypothetical protein
MPSRSVFLVCLTALLAGSRPSAACQCGRIPPLREALEGAEAVFAGRATEIWPVQTRFWEMDAFARRVTFRIEAVWKGDLRREAAVVDPVSDCSYLFRRGGSYLVFAHRTPAGDLYATICSPTQTWPSPEIAALGLGRTIAPDAEVPPESLLHKTGRRLKAAFVGAHFLIAPTWARLADSPGGVFLRFGIEFAACTVLVAFALLARHGRWKRPALILALVALTTGLLVLGISYREIAANPWLKPVIE